MKKPKFPLWILILLVGLIGGIVAITSSTNKNVQKFSDHDHDRDGKADHGSEAHN